MPKRIVLVEAGSPVLEHQSTKILAEYASGEVLIQTTAAANEATNDATDADPHGLVLPESKPQR